MSDLEYLKQVVVSMDGNLKRVPVVRWGTVTSVSPLSVRMDGDESPLIGGFSSIIDRSLLRVGDRVEIILQNARAIIQGIGGGVTQLPEPQYSQHNGAYNHSAGNGVWATIPEATHPFIYLPPRDRPMLVKFTFGGMVKASTGYSMLGVVAQSFPYGEWVLRTQQSYSVDDPDTFAMHTPFVQSTTDTAATGFKLALLPASSRQTVVALQGRRNAASGTNTMNYTSLLVEPIRWV